MHPYSYSESRVKTYGALSVVSVILAVGVTAALSHVTWPEWLIGAPSMAGVFVALYALTDRVLWCTWLFRVLGLCSTPNLTGWYDGELRSTWKDDSGNAVVKPLELRVTQTWTRIQISMVVGGDDRTSRSHSISACVGEPRPTTLLTYHYRNQVNPGVAEEDLGDHSGAAELEISVDGAVTGRYFNSRPRAGSIEAHRRVEGSV